MITRMARFLAISQKKGDFIECGGAGKAEKTAIINGRQDQITSISATEG